MPKPEFCGCNMACAVTLVAIFSVVVCAVSLAVNINDAGENVQVLFAGRPEHWNVTVPLYAPTGVTVMTVDPLLP